MSETPGAPEAQDDQPPDGSIRVAPQFMTQVLQNKVANLTSENTLLEALATQQQATIQELATQVVELQAEVERLRPPPIQDKPPPGRVQPAAAKTAAPA